MFRIRVRGAVQNEGLRPADSASGVTEVDVEWNWKAYIPIWAAFAASIGSLFVAIYNASSNIDLEQERLATQLIAKAAEKSTEQEAICYLHRVDKLGLAALPDDIKQRLTPGTNCP